MLGDLHVHMQAHSPKATEQSELHALLNITQHVLLLVCERSGKAPEKVALDDLKMQLFSNLELCSVIILAGYLGNDLKK